MMKRDGMSKNSSFRLALLFMVAMGLLGTTLWNPHNASANHPVLVEGNCDSPIPGTTILPVIAATPTGTNSAGICGDYDGDGRIGTAEDTDGADRIFGTINAALGPGNGAAAGTGANHNGLITIVKSGRFAETIYIGQNVMMGGGGVANPGNVILQAAPGVEATIDAVLQGDPAGGNNTRAGQNGITIHYTSTDRFVVLRNLTIRNFRSGVLVTGSSHVAIENCRFDSNVDYGVAVRNSSVVTIAKSEVHGTGFRTGIGTDHTPTPGKGIEYADTSTGAVFLTTVSRSFAAGVSNVTTPYNSRAVVMRTSNVFDNNPNFEGISSF